MPGGQISFANGVQRQSFGFSSLWSSRVVSPFIKSLNLSVLNSSNLLFSCAFSKITECLLYITNIGFIIKSDSELSVFKKLEILISKLPISVILVYFISNNNRLSNFLILIVSILK